mmetsp:Transcript_15720/g.49389  ORF Transcript_15720/g.49389 Transcript_15720/m.49389 type:complete len:376 (+) Transcript_15720:71-1198(+)|eukprot:CAMPEP_0182884630 /NCGR_PEP_ID=MMETSP0034_2-20130328/19111_1 /TAXON_ID=156128 /ORGANISM="Nephroselmis pyriformis, Strain CCMP717" /LENGTH=375 /DNA_ID=CAMNT_0025017843 /DNA_START=43 /DNA_END=1170 /DNA_ORIENTATION=+
MATSATIRSVAVPAMAQRACALKQQRSSAMIPGAKALRTSAKLSQKNARAASVITKAVADDAFADYKPKTAFFFPGQGAQSVGMAAELCKENAAAKALFDEASEILGYDLLKVCSEGPADSLNTTAISQPAIFVASFAALEKLKAMDEGAAAMEACNVAAGLSLGEYTALTYAGAMTFADGVRLVKLRGESMQAAADAQPSGMASIIGLDSDKVAELCKVASEAAGEGQGVKIANFLCPGNYAVSGGIKGIEEVSARAKPEFKARMAVKLAVAGAFHTEYMSPAAEQLQEALAATNFVTPRIPVISNVDAVPHSDPETIKKILAQQLTSPVLWENTVGALIEKGCEGAYEIGPNKVIAGICKRIDKKFSVTNIEC